MPKKRLFVLDTNVLIHDPSAIFKFQEHDIFLPMVVLEELDHNKLGLSEVARNARQASRYMDDLISKCRTTIEEGFPLAQINQTEKSRLGRLFFQTKVVHQELPAELPGNIPDNTILAAILALRDNEKHDVTLVSKDINLRIKAAVLGIHAEDYYDDQVLQDTDVLYPGIEQLPDDFWDKHGKNMESWQDNGLTYYKVKGPLVEKWHPNQCLLNEQEDIQAMVKTIDKNHATIRLCTDYINTSHAIWGICARNREQNFALNLLMDSDIDFVSLVGVAGSGKTLLTLASALTQTLDRNLYREIIMTRVTIPLGEDIGFLPGSEEEKMTPWMGALMDNLEVLAKPDMGGNWGRAATVDLLKNRIKIRSVNFMRGRTFLNKFVIIDEAQNLTAKQMRALVTRAGPGSKIVCLGNIAQIDTPYLSANTSGLTYVVDRFKKWSHSAHLTLTRGERSRLADYAADIL